MECIMYSVERIFFQSSCLRHGHNGIHCRAKEQLTLPLFTKGEESINELFRKEDYVIKKIGFPKQQRQGQINLGHNQRIYFFFSFFFFSELCNNLLTNTVLQKIRIVTFKKDLSYPQGELTLCGMNVQSTEKL